MLQKNRDYTGQNLISARLFRAMPGRYKILTVGDLWSSGAGAVMNEKGVMITQNDGLCWEVQPRKVSVGSVFMLRYLAEHCGSADDALAVLQKMYARGFMRDGDLYFIADCSKGYVIETTANHIASIRQIVFLHQAWQMRIEYSTVLICQAIFVVNLPEYLLKISI